MINLGNGSVTVNNKKYAINWTGQYARHITENYINQKPGHTILHVEIQQSLAHSKEIYKDGVNNYSAYTDTPDGVIFVPFEKKSNFVNPKTGFKFNSTMEKVTKNKTNKISGSIKTFYINKEDIEAVYSDGNVVDTFEDAKEFLIKAFTRMYKKRGYKNFELEFV